MSCEQDLFDYRLKVAGSAIIAGPSMSGKSRLCKEIIRRRDEVFDKPIRRIIYCYTEWQQELFSDMKKHAPNIEFIRGLDYEIPEGNQEPILLFCDDLMTEATHGKKVEDLFVRECHHR